MFEEPDKVFRFGVPPLRIDLLTSITGRTFGPCFAERVVSDLDGVETSIISLENLRANKKAAGRMKDLSDLEQLP
jgi:hypothetical protein